MTTPTIWSQLTESERAEWMRENPEQAKASRDGREPPGVPNTAKFPKIEKSNWRQKKAPWEDH